MNRLLNITVPPVNKGQSSIKIDFHSFQKHVEENLAGCIQRVINIRAEESQNFSSILNSCVPLVTLKEIWEDDVDILNKYLGNETRLNMTNFIFRKQCEIVGFYYKTLEVYYQSCIQLNSVKKIYGLIFSRHLWFGSICNRKTFWMKNVSRKEEKIDEALTMMNY